jgi:hypothetical protein
MKELKFPERSEQDSHISILTLREFNINLKTRKISSFLSYPRARRRATFLKYMQNQP